MTYLKKHVSKSNIPQSKPLFPTQVKNEAGGYVFQVSELEQLKRFLIIGTSGGTYYANERKITTDNIRNIERLLDKNGIEAIQLAVEISQAGRAPKNDQAILLLAIASTHKNPLVRKAAYEAVPLVCRIGTHLYQFVDFRKELDGGWGSGMKNCISNWFNDKTAKDVAYQVAKYKNRESWAARDLLRLSHPKAASKEHDAVYKWVTSNGVEVKEGLPNFLSICNEVKEIGNKEKIGKRDLNKIVKYITENNLPREVLPTGVLGEKEIWQALIPGMGATALVRNLGKMSSINLLATGSEETRAVCKKLTDIEFLKKGRVHPINLLAAKLTYEQGRGDKGSLTWNVNETVSSALEDAFYLSFGTVEPTNKNTMIALDVSGSMGFSVGFGKLTAAMVSSVMAMTTLRTETYNSFIMGFASQFKDLGINKNMSLNEVLKRVVMNNFGSTDCSIPMTWAEKEGIKLDAIICYTDNETWVGRIHPYQALRNYQKKFGLNTKLITVATTAARSSIGDKTDPNCLDLVGFDSATPQLISEFIKD